MREPLRDNLRLVHILDACELIKGYYPDYKLPNLDSKTIEYFGLVKNLEIIGEAAYKLTKEFTAAHPLTDWKSIIHMRHIMVHGYYQVNPSIVKDIIENDLPILEWQVRQYLEEM